MTADPNPRHVWFDVGWWVMPSGQRRLLSWNAGTKELKWWSLTRDDEDTVVAVIDTEEEVRRRLEGWEAYNDTKEGLAWLAQRLDGCR